MFHRPTDKTEIKSIFMKLKNKRVLAHDHIAEALKDIATEIFKPPKYFINNTFKKCPHIIKKTMLTPIYKSSHRLDTTNYRSIILITRIANNFRKIF